MKKRLLMATLSVIMVSGCSLGARPNSGDGSKPAASSSTTVPESTTSASTTTTVQRTPAREPCSDGKWTVRMDANERNRVLGEGVKAVTSEEFRKEILDFNHHDPRGLFQYYNASPLGELSLIENYADLFEGGVVQNGVCFSSLGKERYAEWATLWKTAKIKQVDSMPPGWTNTGVDQPTGTPTSGEPPSGDTKGWIIVFVDTSGQPTGSHGAMKRCGNPVTPKPTSPPGPTDEPTPHCPWNPALPPDHQLCLEPKNPAEDPLVNPEIPDEVQGPGTTPVGTDPGDPVEPVDDDTGGATTTTSRPGPSTTTTSRPTPSTVPGTTPTTNGTDTTVTTFGSG